MAPMAKSFNLVPLLLTLTCLFCCYSTISSSQPFPDPDGFFRCVSAAKIQVYQKLEEEFNSQLKMYTRNARFLGNTIGRPLYIVVPKSAGDVQAAVRCGREKKMPIRVRSGGHDYEGLSYRSLDADAVFAMVDMSELHTVKVDLDTKTAWVDSGASLGQLYYEIGEDSATLGFPAGVCPTVGVGGQFTGGGFGMLMRKYGLAIDNIIDAELVNAKGHLLKKADMGKEVFWAIRGGSGGSFGVVVRWQVNLVEVPAKVAVFNVSVSGEEARPLVEEWQDVAPRLPNEVYMRALLRTGNTVDLRSMYLGTCDAFFREIASRFTKLKFPPSNCKEMTWRESVPYLYLGTMDVKKLQNRTTSNSDSTVAFKAKTDYVRKKIKSEVWDEIFSRLNKAKKGQVVLVPYGGKMKEPVDSPFPHRQGVLYHMQYYNYWPATEKKVEHEATEWLKDMYKYMDEYVARPGPGSTVRGAYANCRDLGLGPDYGRKYFEGNYERLTKVKALFDPDNYFHDEQSIPLRPYARAPRLQRSRPLFSSF